MDHRVPLDRDRVPLVSDFGDSEPEDAWHPDDPIPEQLDNIRRRIILLVAAARDGRWEDREEIRTRDIDEDLLFVIERILSG
jgi:hypothetical protein